MKVNQRLFLATTALEEFWDASKPIVFLSDACLRYSRKEIWEDLDYQVFKSPLENRQEFNKAYKFVDGIYERMLPFLAENLNSIHNIKKSNKFWRIFIGPWLMHYIHIIYERFVSIESVFNYHQNLTSIGLSQDGFVVPSDFNDFISLACGDVYNLQIYTKIFDFFGKDFPKKKLNVTQPSCLKNYKSINQFSIKKIIKNYFKNLSPIIVKNSYFPSPSVELALFLRTKGRVFFDHVDGSIMPEMAFDIEKRNLLRDEFKCDFQITFENLLNNLLPFDMPKAYLEGFENLNKSMLRLGKRPKAIVSSEAWYFNDLFKLWAATCSEEGTTLVGIQHGSNYGIASIIPHEDHEMRITSKFYSWGWNNNNSLNVKPLPAPRLMHHKTIAADNKKEGILFIPNSFPRYFYGFQDFRNYDNNNYFDWQRRFYNSVVKDVRKRIKVRIFPVDYGCDCKERWYDLDKSVQMEELSIPFLDSLKNCRLSVHDHLANTFLESLFVNKPTILFWDLNVFMVRREASPFFEELNTSGILFYNPEEAANAVSEIYEDVEKWWLDPTRQRARENFCNKFAISNSDAVNMWATEFINILKQKA